MNLATTRKEKKLLKNGKETSEYANNNETEVQNDVSEINKLLSIDCLIGIFAYLPIKDKIKIERVCRKWNSLSKLSWSSFKNLDLTYLFRNTKLFHGNKTVLDNNQIFYKFISKCGKYLSVVNIGSVIIAENFNLSLILYYLAISCNNIVNFTVYGRNLREPDVNFGFLFLQNKGLKYVYIQFAQMNGNCLLNLPIDTLEVLILRQVSIVPVIPDFKIFFKNLKTFRNIDYHTYSEPEKVFDFLPDKMTISFSPNITEFVFLNPNFNSNSVNLMRLLSEMKNLKTLKIGECKINKVLLRNLPLETIETLIFDNCTVTQACIVYCLQQIKNLSTLGLLNIFIDEDLVKAFTFGKNLKFLDINSSNLSQISSITMHQLFQDLSKLEILDLTSCEISDHFLAIIALHCKSLKALNLSDCEDFTDSGLTFITTLLKIERLFIFRNYNVTDSALSCLPNIKELKCSCWGRIKSAGLCKMLKTSPYIETLDITKCDDTIIEKIIDTAIETKSIRGKKILKIFISNQDLFEKYIKKNLSSFHIKIIYDKNGEKLTFSDNVIC